MNSGDRFQIASPEKRHHTDINNNCVVVTGQHRVECSFVSFRAAFAGLVIR